MRDLVTKVVDDSTYQFEQFNTTDSLKTLARLTKILGEPMTIALGAFFKEGEKPKTGSLGTDGVPKSSATTGVLDRDVNTDVMAKAVHALIERLDENEVVALVKKLTGEKVLCDNQLVVFDLHYAGRPLHLFKVVAAALEAQFGNFIGAMSGRVPAGLSNMAQGIRAR